MTRLLLVLGMLVPAFAAPDRCSYNDGDCTVAAEYFTGSNVTVWSAACVGGFVQTGVAGGDLVPGICGA